MNKNNGNWILKDALTFYGENQLDTENNFSRIFIEPPDEDNTSCEDSDDELPAKVFDSNCEIVLRNGKRLRHGTSNCANDSNNKVASKRNCDKKSPPKRKRKLPILKPNSDNNSVEVISKRINDNNNNVKTNAIEECCDDQSGNKKEAETSKKKATNGEGYVWVEDTSNPMISIFPSPNYTDCTGNTSIEQFEKFFDNELLTLIVNESSKYANYLGKPDPNITIEELKVYIGILVVSGYSVQSRLESYWSSDPDLRNECVYQSMRKNRFKQISQFLHFKDMNQPNTPDKIWKLRPLTDHLKKKMLQNFHPEQDLSYDESMIEYYGRHGMKQCLKPKPIPFGFKVWSLCTTAGYLANFEIYQGKNPRSKTEHEERFGKCIAPLFDMIEDFDDNVRALPFSFYFDNLFTGIKALAHLKSLGYNGTGTIRENRLPKGCPLKEKKNETIKLGRGYMTSKSIKGMDVHVTKWVDNSVVSIASTVYGMQPATTALRYSKMEKAKIEVPRPLVVAKYNQGMGGVDRMDENISLYRIGIHGKKWWSCIFTWMIDVSIQNAWQLHRVAHPEMPQLDFRRQITLFYCRHYGVPPKSTGNRKRKIAQMDSSNLRFDNLSHWPKHIAKRRRCAGENCKTIGRNMCAKCGVGLCIDCFETYHSLEKFKQ